MQITIDINSAEELLSDFEWNEGMKTEENINYIKKNFDKIIDSEKETIERLAKLGNCNKEIIRDNESELWITNDKGEELGRTFFNTDFLEEDED